MWFKQNEQKTPQQQQTETAQPQQQAAAPPAPQVAPAEPVAQAPRAVAPAPQPLAPAAHASRITPGIHVKGEISGREDLWIGGNVEGTLRFDGSRVVLGGSGKMRGRVEAREIVIEGNSDGDLSAAERLEISSTGTARGDASAPRVALQEGAVFNGSVETVRAGEPRTAQPASKPAPARGASPPPQSAPARPQNTQAAGAAAGAAVSASPIESGNGEGATVLARGIASDSSEQSN